jgi:cell fate (sporulation/competence/biofilm development) regulator YlbF (YheA/YmcA/DUF963 family)
MGAGLTEPTKLVAALRFYEMAVDQKKLNKAREAFSQAHKLDLVQTYHEAMRALDSR